MKFPLTKKGSVFYVLRVKSLSSLKKHTCHYVSNVVKAAVSIRLGLRRMQKDLWLFKQWETFLNMTRWQKNRIWCMGLFLTCLFLLLVGCEGGGSDNCGGIDDIVSCVLITNVAPSNAAVDIADCDANGFPDPPVLNATVAFSFRNEAFPSFVGATTDSLSVTIQSVRITYTPQCGAGQVCPALSSHNQALQVFIDENGGSATADITLVSAFTQGQYAGAIPDPDNPASYIANYEFTVRTNFFEDEFDIEATVPFSIGNFSCS